MHQSIHPHIHPHIHPSIGDDIELTLQQDLLYVGLPELCPKLPHKAFLSPLPAQRLALKPGSRPTADVSSCMWLRLEAAVIPNPGPGGFTEVRDTLSSS